MIAGFIKADIIHFPVDKRGLLRRTTKVGPYIFIPNYLLRFLLSTIHYSRLSSHPVGGGSTNPYDGILIFFAFRRSFRDRQNILSIRVHPHQT